MKDLIKYLILALTCLTISTSAQENKEVKGAIFLIAPGPNEDNPDSIQVMILKGIIGLGYDKQVINAKKGPDGFYSFSLPKNQPIITFCIYAFYNKQKEQSLFYYAEPSDQIKIEFTRNKAIRRYTTPKQELFLNFKGKGCDKYNVINTLEKLRLDLSINETARMISEFGNEDNSKGKIESLDYHKSIAFDKYLNDLFLNVQQSTRSIKDTLQKHEVKIGRQIASFFNYEFSTYFYFRFYINQLFYRSSTLAGRQAIANFYFSKIDCLIPEPNDSFVKYARIFKFYRNMDISEELFFKTMGKRYSYQTQFDAIKQIPNLELRDMLLTDFLVQPGFGKYISNNQAKDSCINNALKFIKLPELKLAINNQKLFSKGSKVYDFSFPDTTGKMINLVGMKGKVFMMDFSGLGCAHCAIFARRFKLEIYPEFINNPKFKVLSINVDSKREYWLKAIKSGIYTQEHAIELNTGDGFDHPIFKYYGVSSVPFVLLVGSNGKLVSRISSSYSSAEISNLIRNALNENVLSAIGSK